METYSNPVVGRLVEFVSDEQFQGLFENYFLTYAPEFDDVDEHKLRYFELYKDFQTMFEGQLEAFCEREKISQLEFTAMCREATISDPNAKKYIDVLLSSADYDTFVRLMKIMKPVALSRSADAKILKEKKSTVDDKGQYTNERKQDDKISDGNKINQGNPKSYYADAKEVRDTVPEKYANK